MEHSLGAFDYDTIYLGDALELMPAIPDGSLILIITDPPFAIDFKSGKRELQPYQLRVLQGYRRFWNRLFEFTHRWMSDAARVLAPTGVCMFSPLEPPHGISLKGLDEAAFTNSQPSSYEISVRCRFTKKKDSVTSHYHILFV